MELRTSSSLNLHSYSMGNISEYIRQGLLFHKKAGFDAADFPDDLFEKMGEDWEKYLTIAMDDAKEIGIRFELCHLPFDWRVCSAPERAEALNVSVHRAIEAARFLGVNYAVLHPNTTTILAADFDHQTHYDAVMGHLAPFAEHAAKVGLNIVVENMCISHKPHPVHRYCGDPEELCEIADALGIGVCWDFGHAHINGLVQSEALSYVGSRLKVLHVNDNFAKGDVHLPPYMGNLDWQDVRKGLEAVGFTGLFNYEITMERIPAGAREAFARYLVDVAMEIMK